MFGVTKWYEHHYNVMKGGLTDMFKKAIGVLSLCALLLSACPAVVRAETLSYAIDPQYEGGAPFVGGVAVVAKFGKWGVIDKKGKVVARFKYDAVHNFVDGVAVVGMGRDADMKFGFINDKGDEITPITYDFAVAVGDGYGRVMMKGPSGNVWDDGRTGLVGKGGEITPPSYEAIHGFADGMFKAQKGGKYGYLDANGKEATGFVYEAAEDFSDGLGLVRLNGKYGFVDRTGKLAIPFVEKAQFVNRFSEGLAQIVVDGMSGYIDTFGNVVIPPKYEEAWFFDQGLARVARNGKYGYIDRTGKEVVPLRYDEASAEIRHGLARVVVGEDYILRPGPGEDEYFGNEGNKDYRVLTTEKFGFVNASGDEVVPLQYDYAEEFVNGFAKVSKGGSGSGAYYQGAKFGYIDTTGKEVVPLRYDFVGGDIFDSFAGFSEGFVTVSNGGTGGLYDYTGGKWGYVDQSGREIVPLIYDHASSFRGGLGRVLKNGKYGFVDATGTEVVPCIYDEAGDFINGMAEVVRGGKAGYIDVAGREVTSMKYKGIKPFLEGMGTVVEDGDDGRLGYLRNPLSTAAPVSIGIATSDDGGPATVSLTSATRGVTIYYTTDGTEPNSRFAAGGTYQYTGPFTLWKSATIKAVAVAKGMQNTPLARLDYRHTYKPITPAVAAHPHPQERPAGTGSTDLPAGFVDVDKHHWARHSIRWALDKNIVSYGDGTFRPDEMVTEPEFLAMLLRAYPDFAVPADAGSNAPWYAPYYKVAAQNNWPLLHEADRKRFTRGQMALLLAATQGFSFEKATDAVQYVLDQSLAGGKTARNVEGFAMDSGLTRAEAITLIHNMKERGLKLGKAAVTAGDQDAEFVVSGISIGDPEKKVLDLLGEPARKDLSEYGFYWYIYNQDYTKYVQVGVQNGRVVALYSNHANWSSRRGIRLGSAEDAVIKSYGTPSDREPDTTLKLYLLDGSYTTFFLDNHMGNTVMAIQLIEQSVEEAMTDDFGTESEELRTAFEQQTVDILNSIRARLGLKPVEHHAAASAVARKHSEDMRDRNYAWHVSPEGKDQNDRMRDAGLPSASENIAAGQRSPVFAIHSWMSSYDGHRENMLMDWQWLGVGVAFNGVKHKDFRLNHTGYNMYWTQVFFDDGPVSPGSGGTEQATPQEREEQRRNQVANDLADNYPFAEDLFELVVLERFPQPDGSEVKNYGLRSTTSFTLPPFSAIYVTTGTNYFAFEDDYHNYRFGGKLVVANHTDQPKLFRAGEITYALESMYRDAMGTVTNPDGTKLTLKSTGPYVRMILFDGDFVESEPYEDYMERKKVLLATDWVTVKPEE